MKCSDAVLAKKYKHPQAQQQTTKTKKGGCGTTVVTKVSAFKTDSMKSLTAERFCRRILNKGRAHALSKRGTRIFDLSCSIEVLD